MPPTPTPSPPHVVLIMCDQLRADALGFMGNPIVRTPNLDRLAHRGTVFDQLYVQASVCMPSRASILTGRYPRTARMGHHAGLLDPREVTCAESFQRQGYRTGLFGKLHLTPQQYTHETFKTMNPVCDAEPFMDAAGLPPIPDDPCKKRYGFQDAVSYEDALPGEYIAWLQQRDPVLADKLPKWPDHGMSPWAGAPREFLPAIRDVAKTEVPPELHPSMFIAESAAAHFSEHAKHQPCFSLVSFVDPHHPFDPPQELAAHYPASEMPLPQHRDAGNVRWPQRLIDRASSFTDVDDHITRTIIGYYYAMIEMVDMAVGRLVQAIEDAGQMDNTVIAFVADHGELLGDHGLFRKGSYHYDSLIRSPAFICGPNVQPGRRVEGLAQAIDIAPTLLDLAGCSIHAGVQGTSHAEGLADGGSIDGRPWVYSEMFEARGGPYIGCWTVRSPTSKLNFYPLDNVGHLFDLTQDPGEQCDVYDSPDHRPLRDEMTALLLRAVHDQHDPLPRYLSQY